MKPEELGAQFVDMCEDLMRTSRNIHTPLELTLKILISPEGVYFISEFDDRKITNYLTGTMKESQP